MEVDAVGTTKGPANIVGAFRPGQSGLGHRRFDTADEVGSNRQSHRPTQVEGEAFRLVELPFPLLDRVERHGNHQIPSTADQFRRGRFDQPAAKQGFKPAGALVFEPMDDLAGDAIRHDGGADRFEGQIHLATVGAFEGGGDRACEGKSAPMAVRRFQSADTRLTSGADKPVPDLRRFLAAELAEGRVQEPQKGFRGGSNTPASTRKPPR
jgi:hypothetical protein